MKNNRKKRRKALLNRIDPTYPWFVDFLDKKCIESTQRKCGGNGVCWVVHRFPIKGGINWAEVIARNAYRPNALLETLKRKKTRA